MEFIYELVNPRLTFNLRGVNKLEKHNFLRQIEKRAKKRSGNLKSRSSLRAGLVRRDYVILKNS